FCDDQLRLGNGARKALGAAANVLKRAAEAANFKGKAGSALDLIAPVGVKAARVIVVGAGKASDLNEYALTKLGGSAAGKITTAMKDVTIVADLPHGALK